MRSGMERGLAAIECDAGKGGRVTRLGESLRRKEAVDDGARLARCQGVGIARCVDPTDRIHQCDEEIDTDDGDRKWAAPPKLGHVLSPKAVAPHITPRTDRP